MKHQPLGAFAFAALLAASPLSAQPRHFTVHVVDAASRAPIAGVALQTDVPAFDGQTPP